MDLSAAVSSGITRHAAKRWRERVDPGASLLEARSALQVFLLGGRSRSTPRRWTAVRPGPGLSFVYSARQPGVCAVVLGSTVVTVLTRALCRRTTAWQAEDGERRGRRLTCLAPTPTWRWDGTREAA